MPGRVWFWAGSTVLLLAVRLAHREVLWVDEAYGLAAARRMLEGAWLYTGIWFDKPPLYAWIYLLAGAKAGIPLRLLGAGFALLCVWLAGRAAGRLFGEQEGRWAAALMAFFLAFDHPVALLPLAPDLLLVPFALGAVWAVAAGRPVTAGLVAGLGLLANTKAVLLLAVLLAVNLRAAAGFAVGALAAWLVSPGWMTPVWKWGWLYSRDTFLAQPALEGLRRTANWCGFHAALVLGAGWFVARVRAQRLLLGVWAGAALVMAAAGWRFFPRYYFALLPVLVVMAAAGWTRWPVRRRVAVLALALAVPAVRFGRAHLAVAAGSSRDLAMFEECRTAAELIRRQARAGDTLFVWGYRPELNVLAGLPGAGPFLDSQPLTGVIADRHLTSSRATAPRLAEENRRRLVRTNPTFIADGLGPYNAELGITRFADLQEWLSRYDRVGETAGFRIYRRREAF